MTELPLPESHLDVLAGKLADSLRGLPPSGTPRRVHGEVTRPGKVTAVVGMRRSGKTTLLHQVRQQRLASGAAIECLPFVNFEDERLMGLGADQLGPLVEHHYRQYPSLRGRTTVVWCLDEIQLVTGWERFARRLLDSEQVELLVSGSSAASLSREIATSLRGRAWEVVLPPFSFEEALRHAGQAVPESLDFLDGPSRSQLEHAFIEYVTVGGFPEVQGTVTATRFQILRDYVDVAMLRDVVERHQVGNVVALRWLVRQLLGNAGGSFSVEKFHAALKSQGLSIARDTVHQLLDHLQDCFLVRTVWMESKSERQRMVNPRKSYPIDPALIAIFDRTGRANLGHALETAVLIELERRRAEVTYVKTAEGYEVDFLARYPDGTEELVQVCADAGEPATAERELRALAAARDSFPRAQPRLLSLTRAGRPSAVPPGVVAEPAYEWMLRSTP